MDLTGLFRKISDVNSTVSKHDFKNDVITDDILLSLFDPKLSSISQSMENNCTNGNFTCMCVNDSIQLSNLTAVTATDWTGCDWIPANHVYFQLANACLFLSYLAPNGIFGILFLRCVLFIGSVFFSLWGWTILCALDTFIWNIIFAVINLVQAVIIIHSIWPVKFTPEIEEVYKRLFQPLQVPRHLFKQLVSIAQFQDLNEGEYYAREGKSVADSLGLLVTGSFDVYFKDHYFHTCHEFEFIDSPEYLAFKQGDCFMVSVIAKEDCRVIRWHQPKLKKLFRKQPFLAAILENMAGRDVSEKLFVMNRKLVQQTGAVSQDIRMASLISMQMLAVNPGYVETVTNMLHTSTDLVINRNDIVMSNGNEDEAIEQVSIV